MEKYNKSIWKNEDKDRFFLVSDDAQLSEGDYLIRTSTGREKLVELEQLQHHEISAEEATQWLKTELGDVMSQFRENLTSRAQQRKDAYPDKLADLYRKRTEGGSNSELATLLNELSDKSEAIPNRMKNRMKEIARRFNRQNDENNS